MSTDLLPSQERMFYMLLDLSQLVAERHHGKQAVADAIEAAKERFGPQWSLFMLPGAGDPYEKLMTWHKEALEKKPRVVGLQRGADV